MDPVEVRGQRASTGGAVATEPAPADVPVEAVGRRAPVAADTPTAAAPAATRTYPSRTVSTGPNRLNQLIWLLAGIADAILALDFIFRAAAGANTGFAHYVYRVGGWLAAPFNGIFTNGLVNGHTVIRWADVLAVVIFTLAALALTRLVLILSRPRGRPAV